MTVYIIIALIVLLTLNYKRYTAGLEQKLYKTIQNVTYDGNNIEHETFVHDISFDQAVKFAIKHGANKEYYKYDPDCINFVMHIEPYFTFTHEDRFYAIRFSKDILDSVCIQIKGNFAMNGQPDFNEQKPAIIPADEYKNNIISAYCKKLADLGLSDDKETDDKEANKNKEITHDSYLELINHIPIIDVLSKNTEFKQVLLQFLANNTQTIWQEEIQCVLQLLLTIHKYTQIPVNTLYDNEINPLKQYIEELNQSGLGTSIIRKAIEEDAANFCQRISSTLQIFLPNRELAEYFILMEINKIIKESEEGKNFAEQSGFKTSKYEVPFLYAPENMPIEENFTEEYLADYLHLILEEIPDQTTRHKCHILIIDNCMQFFKLGKYTDNQ